jgi:hypothetical protein
MKGGTSEHTYDADGVMKCTVCEETQPVGAGNLVQCPNCASFSMVNMQYIEDDS